jgi:hypothetical protein
MSDTSEVIERDQQGRFLTGVKAGPGRPLGSRNKLADAFVTDLRDLWAVRGVEVLERVATDDPATLLKVVASLMPKDLNLHHDVSIDVGDFATRFRAAVALLGNEPKVKVVEHVTRKRR